jgi:hypothetical protein
MTEDSGQPTADGGQPTADGGQPTAVSGQPTAVGAPPLADLPIPSGAYRTPPFDTAPPVHLPPTRRPWVILGPALSVFAAALWAFVVAGQFTTSWTTGAPLGQGAAIAFVLLVTLAAWIAGLRAGQAAAAARNLGFLVARGIGVAFLAWVLFVLHLIAATVAGNVLSKSHDVLIPFVLVAVATVAAVAGPRITSPVRPIRSHGAKVALTVLWIGGALLTLLAGADLVANG